MWRGVRVKEFTEFNYEADLSLKQKLIMCYNILRYGKFSLKVEYKGEVLE